MNEIVLPNDANPLGALLGGRLMHWIDLAGAMAAHRHSRKLRGDGLDRSHRFLDPGAGRRSGRFCAHRSIGCFTTSMEVGVKVWVENYISR